MEKKQVPATIHAGVGKGLQLNTIEDIQRAARLFIASGMFAEKNVEADMAKACVKLIAGQELGLSAFQSMRGIDIVKGQPTFRYQLVGAKIKQTGRYDFKPVEVSATRAAIQFYDNGKPVFLSEFTIADAKAQGLADKDNYRRIPKDMLYARALTNGANKVCPEIFFAQCYAPEDFGETSGEMVITDADTTATEWQPTRQDWYNLIDDCVAAGANQAEVEAFIADNKGKALGSVGIFERTKQLFLGEQKHDTTDDAGTGDELDAEFADAIAGE